MAMARSTVVGVFTDRDSAERAIDELHRMSFGDNEIGFIWRSGLEGDVHEPSVDQATDDDENQPGEGAAAGMAAGAGLGGALAAAAALAIPGIGPVLAGGILSTIIGGAAAGAAAGGLVGMLGGMGVSDEEAGYYQGEFKQGRILVTVKADGRYMEAQEALRRAGAYDVDSSRAA